MVYPNISLDFHLSSTCLWHALMSVSFYLDTRSLTRGLMRKTVLINKGCEVTGLREVLLVRV